MQQKQISSGAWIKKAMAVFVIAGLMIHITIILYLTFFSESSSSKFLPLRLYHHYIHIGPFFRADAIQASTHFLVGFRTSEGWHHIDVTDSLVRQYHAAPWKTHKLTKRDYIREVSRELPGKGGVFKKNKFVELYSYLVTEYPEIQHGDSTSFLNVVRWYKPEQKRHVADTLFHFKIRNDDVR